MKTLRQLLTALLLAATAVGCDAFHSLTRANLPQSLGSPYELVVVCDHAEWTGAVGDSLRALLTAPVPYLPQTEPLFDVLRVTERGYSDMVVNHRNILRVEVDPALEAASTSVQYDRTSHPQIVLTLQGPDQQAVADYIGQHGGEMVQVLEKAERDRAIEYAGAFREEYLEKVIRETFGIEMTVPKGYVLAKKEADFVWARYEFPNASQGFFLYSTPYQGKESLSPEALLAARNKFAARIPGPSDGSYMITSEAFEPEYRVFRLEGRLWCELRGFWDVENDFMGGPFVSYSTVDTQTDRVITLDGYVYAPDLKKPRKRNYMRGVEHLLYLIKVP